MYPKLKLIKGNVQGDFEKDLEEKEAFNQARNKMATEIKKKARSIKELILSSKEVECVDEEHLKRLAKAISKEFTKGL